MSDSVAPVTAMSNDNPQLDRITKLEEAFTSVYGYKSGFIARASGRVNLIGEHIDYCGYAVLPMAIEQDIMIAFSPTSSLELNICNRAPLYPDFKCSVQDVQIDRKNPNWHNYVLCGFRGIVDHFGIRTPKGMDLCVDGTIPPSAGLSSSSALVCSAALATLHANGLTMPKKELAALCAHAEHLIGTEGGGMDQAISFLAEPGTAKLIEFNPLKTTDVKLPEGAVFVITNSCADLNKASTSHYNTRVAECRLAAQILAKSGGLDWTKYRILGEVQQTLGIPLCEMEEIVAKTFHKDPYTKQEVCEILNVSEGKLEEISLSEKTCNLDSFMLYQRAMHVFTEANRVWEFKTVCDKNDKNALAALGTLMNASHASCRDLFECSHPNLDTVVDIALKAGALGSRLTGAGWGGCAVSLVPSNKVSSFLEEVKRNFYNKTSERSKNITSRIFPTQPGGGAVIYKF